MLPGDPVLDTEDSNLEQACTPINEPSSWSLEKEDCSVMAAIQNCEWVTTISAQTRRLTLDLQRHYLLWILGD